MGIDDMLGKAKDALSGHEDQVDDVMDKGAEQVKSHTPDSVDSAVDSGVDQAKKLFGGE